MGAPNSSAGGAISAMTPLWKKATRSDTSRANFISCVTQIIVMPSDASIRSVSSTSPTSMGSRADVTSSNSM